MCAHLGPGAHGKLRCDNDRPHDENGELNHTYTGSFVDTAQCPKEEL